MPDASALRAALLQKFPDNAYSLCWEVANATGAAHRRWADAVAMSSWPSRGLTLQGFELKVSRSDWVRELRNPEKAESICQYCDYWWLVVSDKGIVRAGELPPTWGLLVLNSRGTLTTATNAPRLEAQPIDRKFLAALLRAAATPAVANSAAALGKEYERGRQSEMESHNRALKHATDKLQELTDSVRAFERAAGFSIHKTWDHSTADIGQVVKDVLAGKHDRDRDDIARCRRLASELVERIDGSGILNEETANA